MARAIPPPGWYFPIAPLGPPYYWTGKSTRKYSNIFGISIRLDVQLGRVDVVVCLESPDRLARFAGGDFEWRGNEPYTKWKGRDITPAIKEALEKAKAQS